VNGGSERDGGVNQANGDFSDRSRPQEYADEVPPWGTPPRRGRHGEPGHTVEPEPDPEVPDRSQPPYPEPNEGLVALVLGLVGLFLFPPVAPVAWIIGRREVRAVHQGRRDPRRRALGQIGLIMGIIGTVVFVVVALILAVVVTVLVVVFT
jgi:hypothetical protein